MIRLAVLAATVTLAAPVAAQAAEHSFTLAQAHVIAQREFGHELGSQGYTDYGCHWRAPQVAACRAETFLTLTATATGPDLFTLSTYPDYYMLTILIGHTGACPTASSGTDASTQATCTHGRLGVVRPATMVAQDG